MSTQRRTRSATRQFAPEPAAKRMRLAVLAAEGRQQYDSVALALVFERVFPGSALAVLGVCRQWRTVALEAREAWRSYRVTVTGAEADFALAAERVPHLLQRAGIVCLEACSATVALLRKLDACAAHSVELLFNEKGRPRCLNSKEALKLHYGWVARLPAAFPHAESLTALKCQSLEHLFCAAAGLPVLRRLVLLDSNFNRSTKGVKHTVLPAVRELVVGKRDYDVRGDLVRLPAVVPCIESLELFMVSLGTVEAITRSLREHQATLKRLRFVTSTPTPPLFCSWLEEQHIAFTYKVVTSHWWESRVVWGSTGPYPYDVPMVALV
eukprot:TRINITY_DN9310_c0_g1_i1.p1 TRINITY_DN9310_c0_g1~~TRINITY_DN9310_c0_g1_i1.p1  ORF type:complete len:325 (-),score=89.25 TRINITY_DN9310_c0_g1_i1:36-1010(-)